MNTRHAKLTEGSILSSLLFLAVPIILANLLQAGYQLIDAFWVGRLGGAAVAAVSVSFPVTFLMISLGAGFAVAGSILIAQYVGAGDVRQVNHVAGQTLLMVVILSSVLGGVGYVLAPSILKLMGVAPDVYEGALAFMRISFIGLLFSFLFFMFQSIMRGIGQVTLPLYIVAGTVLLNFLLDPILIFGWKSIPALGVEGAAIATFITQCIAAVIGLIVLFTGKYGIHITLADIKPDWALIKRSFFLGLPASIEQSSHALGLTVMTFIIASFGTVTMAAYGAGSNIIHVIIIPVMGLSMAISTLVGQNIGAGKIERAERIGKMGTWVSFWLLSGLGVVAFIFAPQLIGFFVPGDADIITTGTVFLQTVALTWGFLGVQMSLNGVFRASGNMMTAMMLALVTQWLVRFPLAYLLAKHTSLGSAGIWWAFALSYVFTALVAVGIFAKGDWKKKKLIGEEKLLETVTEEVFIEEGVRA